MRLDKFLKVSRLIKRRTVAKEACDAGKISINSKLAKAGNDVKIGDTISISFGENITKYRVLDLKEFARKEEADSLYEQVD